MLCGATFGREVATCVCNMAVGHVGDHECEACQDRWSDE